MRLRVDEWNASLALPPPGRSPVQKNWLPFVHGGALLVEYSVEPRIVLRVDPDSGACELAAPQTSFPPLAALGASHGRVSGGAPAALLSTRRLYLGLAHLKDEHSAPQDVGSARMLYRHVLYAFRAEPPFDVVAATEPGFLPRVAGEAGAAASPPTVQFASGLLVDEARGAVVISYSELDCGGRLAEFALGEVLAEMGLS